MGEEHHAECSSQSGTGWCDCRGLPITLAALESGLPLTTGEGNTARKIRHVLCNCECRSAQTGFEALAELDALLAECGRLREQLNTRQWWLDMQYLLADRNRLREQLDALQKEHDWVGALNKALNEQNDRLVRECGAARGSDTTGAGARNTRPTLREQLDAARQALQEIVDGDSDDWWAREIARAALGVEGPQPDQGSAPTENVGRARDEEPS